MSSVNYAEHQAFLI